MQMEIKFDQKEFMDALAREVIKQERDFWDDADEKYIIYHSSVGDAVKEEISRIIRENENKVFNAVVEMLAGKYAQQIKLAAVLSALSKKE